MVTLRPFSTRSTTSVVSATSVWRPASTFSNRRTSSAAGPAARQRGAVVELRQLGVEIGVVHPELEQLGVGELEQELDVLVAGRRLDHQRRVPAQHGQILLGVAEPAREQVPAGVFGEHARLAQQQLDQRPSSSPLGGTGAPRRRRAG